MKEIELKAVEMSTEEQAALPKVIVRIHIQGQDNKKIVELLGVSLRHVESTLKKYKEGGLEAIAFKKTGRPSGSVKILILEQQNKLREVLITQKPEEYKLNGFLWSMDLIRILVKILFEIEIKRSTMAMYFKYWGYTPQRPIIYNSKQNLETIRRWVEEEYPSIKTRSKTENSTIYWGDETGIQNECNNVVGYAPKGKTPVAKLNSNHKFRLNMFSSINNQGKLRFALYEETMTQQLLITFMKRLIKCCDKKVFLILDNLKVHHGRIVKEWLTNNKDKIEVFYLPSYSPERNPDEYFNGTLKKELEKRGDVNNLKDFKSKVRKTTLKIQSNTERNKKFFEAKDIAYCAE